MKNRTRVKYTLRVTFKFPCLFRVHNCVQCTVVVFNVGGDEVYEPSTDEMPVSTVPTPVFVICFARWIVSFLCSPLIRS